MIFLIAKKHEINGKKILAVCDENLIGKKIETEKIEFFVSERFYGGQKITTEELIELFEEFDSINLIGNNCIEILQKKGLINESSIININNTKHVQIYKI